MTSLSEYGYEKLAEVSVQTDDASGDTWIEMITTNGDWYVVWPYKSDGDVELLAAELRRRGFTSNRCVFMGHRQR